MKFLPALGGKPSEASRARMSKSQHYDSRKFNNLIPTSTAIDASFLEKWKVMGQFIKGNPKGKPAKPLQPVPLDADAWVRAEDDRVAWFGHSAVLLKLDGKTLLIDPMLGRAPSPVPIFGGKRFSAELPAAVDKLPPIDAVLLSHDHYDHLDYGTIVLLRDRVKRFYTPLGVGGHLESWGVPADRIVELDWWEETVFEGIRLACTPARHFSGRSLVGRDGTLWCSWVLHGNQSHVFFSGDSGYGPHFQQIGGKYGPFDLTMVECGQYDERWAAIHMLPEETVQAHLDVRGDVLIPIHWAAFTLALHDWTDPVERAQRQAYELGVRIATPRIGEVVPIGAGGTLSASAWWKG
ncbi:MBL fold metallo-hydrolase [Paenibacillus koleovorans]|uniref:MBL fold metallo-hydrolase n=1 Tax=Paenibacillus koleovorans TaxID=121608 RepID=UPI000FD6CD71|nr:MBL fold metallo-hydrolase [Paenibacillus koleovorans]